MFTSFSIWVYSVSKLLKVLVIITGRVSLQRFPTKGFHAYNAAKEPLTFYSVLNMSANSLHDNSDSGSFNKACLCLVLIKIQLSC